MSETPNTAAIGAFITGAVLILVATGLFLLGSGLGQKETVVMAFDGSVKGLNIGAPLALRGVNIGQVTKMELHLDAQSGNIIMLVEADFYESRIQYSNDNPEVDQRDVLIERGLRAQLNSQSLLTGLLYIELDFHPGTDVNLADIDSPYEQLPTIPTNLERIAKKLQDIDISQLIEDFHNISDTISTMLGSEEFKALPINLTRTLESLTGLSDQLQAQLNTTVPKIDTVLDETATTLELANEEIPRLSELVASNLAVLDEAITGINRASAGVDSLVSYDSATIHQLNATLLEVARAGRALQSLAITLEAEPEALIKGKSGDEK